MGRRPGEGTGRSPLVRRTALATLIASALLGGVATAASDSGRTRAGGTVIVGMPEPPDLNVLARDSAPALWIGHMIVLGAYSVNGRGLYVPSLVAGEPRITQRPFSVTYTIAPRARWSDGVPVSAQDFIFTWQLERSPDIDPDPSLEAAYRRIARARLLAPKRVKFVFDQPYFGWKGLFDFVLPWHALRNQDPSAAWRDTIDDPRTGTPLSDGPFIFRSWSRGDRLTLVRNAHYWRRKPYLNQLVLRFLPDAGSQLDALRARQVDLILPPPFQLLPADLHGGGDIRVLSGPSGGWEHLDFNLGPKGNPGLRNRFVRRAIAYGIDRVGLAAEVSRNVQPGSTSLQNAMIQPYSSAYAEHWRHWTHQPPRALALLRAHGCRRGQDGIFSCASQRLSFRLVSTAGNAARQLAFERVQAELAKIGIEVRGDFEPPPLAFRRIQDSRDWDLALFAWAGTPDATGGDVQIFGCHGSLNYNGYCNPRVSRMLAAALRQLRFDRRSALLNRADALVAKDVPLLPLYEKPGYVLYNSRIRNVRWNPDVDYLVFGNAQDWWIART